MKKIIISVILFLAVSSVYSKNNIKVNFASDSLRIERQNSPIPEKFDLHSPKASLTPQTYILFDVPENANVTMKLFDYDNRFIAELFNKNFEAGTYYFDTYKIAELESLTSGVYFLEMKAGSFSKKKKIIFVK